jgi:hypothetical protein
MTLSAILPAGPLNHPSVYKDSSVNLGELDLSVTLSPQDSPTLKISAEPDVKSITPLKSLTKRPLTDYEIVQHIAFIADEYTSDRTILNGRSLSWISEIDRFYTKFEKLTGRYRESANQIIYAFNNPDKDTTIPDDLFDLRNIYRKKVAEVFADTFHGVKYLTLGELRWFNSVSDVGELKGDHFDRAVLYLDNVERRKSFDEYISEAEKLLEHGKININELLDLAIGLVYGGWGTDRQNERYLNLISRLNKHEGALFSAQIVDALERSPTPNGMDSEIFTAKLLLACGKFDDDAIRLLKEACLSTPEFVAPYRKTKGRTGLGFYFPQPRKEALSGLKEGFPENPHVKELTEKVNSILLIPVKYLDRFNHTIRFLHNGFSQAT